MKKITVRLLCLGLLLSGVGVSHSSQTVVTSSTVEQFWDRGTFPTVRASMNYHHRKHGNGKSLVDYTQQAITFFETHQSKAKWGVWNPRWKPAYKLKLRKQGGYFTRDGKILTYWDDR